MARRKSLAGSNTSRVLDPVHGFDIRAQHAGGGGHTETIMAYIGDSPNITCHCLGFRDATSSWHEHVSSTPCTYVYVRAWVMRRRRNVTAYAHAVRSR